jgi:hypothetical protein
MLSSPVLVCVGYGGPALFADGECFAFDDYVEFDIFALALVFPWVFTLFHVLVSDFLVVVHLLRWLLKGFQQRPVGAAGRGGLK